MNMFSPAELIGMADCFVCALLASAASAKARFLGAHFTGAVILGCLCGMSGPLLREITLHGEQGGRLVISLLPDDALFGSLAGMAFVIMGKKLPAYFLLDSFSVSFVSVFICMLTLQDSGIMAGVSLGLIAAFVPGVIRDLALGDVAEIVENEWYVTSAALGCFAAIAVFLIPFFVPFFAFMENWMLAASIFAGTMVAFIIQLVKRKKR